MADEKTASASAAAAVAASATDLSTGVAARALQSRRRHQWSSA